MKIIALVVVMFACVVGIDSVYIVSMVEQVLITQFGEPVSETIVDPGLHFKIPFIQKVNRFDKRWLDWDGEVDEMRTAEKTPILVDSYARWRIKDALQYFKRLRSERRAQSRLDDIVGSATRNVIARNKLIEVVRSEQRILPENTDMVGQANEGRSRAQSFELGRNQLTREILQAVQDPVSDLGIEVVDVQFQRVNYTRPVEQKAFGRMISERERIAARYRSEGEGESARISGRLTEDLKTIESEAYKRVQEIKGSADATATSIYAAAYNLDPSLYKLLVSLKSYESTVDEKTVMILSTDAEFYEAIKSMR